MRVSFDQVALRRALDTLVEPSPSKSTKKLALEPGMGAPKRTEGKRTKIERRLETFLAPFPHLKKASSAEMRRLLGTAKALRSLLDRPIEESTVEVLQQARRRAMTLGRMLRSAPAVANFPGNQLLLLSRAAEARLREIERVGALPVEAFTDPRKEHAAGLLELQTHTSWGHDTEQSLERFIERWGRMAHNTKVAVIHDKGRTISGAALFIEQRAESGLLGHLENVVTHTKYRRMGLAARVVKDLLEQARKAGCYAVLLSCLPENAPLYASCGFRPAGTQMEYNFPKGGVGPPKLARLEALGLEMARVEEGASLSPSHRALLAERWLSFDPSSGVKKTPAFPEGQKQTYVVKDRHTGEVMATGSVFFEYKLNEGYGKPTAHVSDLVVSERFRGQAVGRALMEQLQLAASEQGAFRIMIQCPLELRPFFAKCGCHDTERQMMFPIDPAFSGKLKAEQPRLQPLA
jgi:glucosamine-phosphate N-acetyltransferase